jgi:two-component system cell cycle response regulator
MRILIAEDDAISRRLLETKLSKWGYEVVAVPDGNAALEALSEEDAPQIAILDWMMPELDGVDVCRAVRASTRESYTYMILLTAQTHEDDLVAGMEAGADDYIAKPFKSSELKMRLRAGRRIIELQTELIAAREVQRAKATHDPLTGLWNHEEILQLMGRELARDTREDSHMTGAIMADLDHFKQVNDTFGHMAGDAVLRAAAQRMLALLRPYDALGRYGGEEFLVVVSGCDPESIATLAERLRAGVAAESVDTSEGIIPVTVSLGVAVNSGRRPVDANVLVQRADRALYCAKEKGRNRVEIDDARSV